MPGPPPALVSSLVDGPSAVSALEWHEEIDSTMRRAADLVSAGAPEIAVVAADVQHAGRGRLGRPWAAPPGTSLMLSLLLRPPVPPADLPLLPLLTGLVLLEVVERTVPGVEAALKWPNDVLLRQDGGAPRKTAGILVEAIGGAAVVGIGCNVDWRGVERPEGLVATSLAEARGAAVDRWRLLAGLLGLYANRYRDWCADPAGFLDAYRSRCATIGSEVAVTRTAAEALHGTAVGVAPSGALQVRTADGALVEVAAGDVTHVRPS